VLFKQNDKNLSGIIPASKLRPLVRLLYPKFDRKSSAFLVAYKKCMSLNNPDSNEVKDTVTAEEFCYYMYYLVYYNNLLPEFPSACDVNRNQEEEKKLTGISQEDFLKIAQITKLKYVEGSVRDLFFAIDVQDEGMIQLGDLCHHLAAPNSGILNSMDDSCEKKGQAGSANASVIESNEISYGGIEPSDRPEFKSKNAAASSGISNCTKSNDKKQVFTKLDLPTKQEPDRKRCTILGSIFGLQFFFRKFKKSEFVLCSVCPS